MSGIKFGVSAELDQAAVEKELKKLTDQLNKAKEEVSRVNKVKYQPVDKSTITDLQKVTKEFDVLVRLSGDLKKRLKDTGQLGLGFHEIDYNRLYPNARARARVLQQHVQYITGQQAQPSGGGAGNAVGVLSGIPGQIAGAAARSAGPVGGVVANAASTAASSGIGAGLAGFLGGIVALGVGKAVSEVTARVGQAEDNLVLYDKLKRTLGDVNVSFDVLKTSVEANASRMGVTLGEAGGLAAMYARGGNLGAGDYRSLLSETGVGIGLGKSFGLDPSEGVGVMSVMRGMGITRNEQDAKRMALLIGETIGKSDAFAKAGEVFDALSSYATSQTRQSLGPANMAGYAGMFSALVGSGIPGLDPAGASGLLGRVNASLTAGGARGEASQFFTSMVGAKMGLDPFQTQILREGGAFATADNSFGEGSIASKYGIGGPGGSQTFLQGTLDLLRKKYGHNKGLLAKATSEHLGVSMRQAMAMQMIPTNAMGEVAGYAGDLSKLNDRGIAGVTKVVTGTDADRRSVASELLGRTGSGALSDSERLELQRTMESGTTEQQKQILATLVASRDQEETDGKNIHDSKVALENVKTLMADKLIPLTQNIRDGILYMAGGGKKSSVEVLTEMADAESAMRTKRIESDFDAKKETVGAQAKERLRNLLMNETPEEMAGLEGWEDLKEKRKRNELTREESFRIQDYKTQKMKEIEAEKQERIKAIERERDDAIQRERARHDGARRGIDRADRINQSAATPLTSLGDIPAGAERNNVGAFLDSIGSAEQAGYNTITGGGSFSDYSKHPNIVGLVTKDGPSTAAGKYQITKGTWDRVAKRLGLEDFSPANQDRAAMELIREAGAMDDIRRGDFDSAVKKLGGIWQALPSGRSPNQSKRTASEFQKMLRTNLRNRDAMVPDGQAGVGQQRFIFDAAPIEIIHRNERGERIRPSQSIAVNIRPASPFGTEKIA